MTNDVQPAPTAQEVAELIAEFEKYRERLVSETMETAQKAKLMKKTVMSQLEPELAKIDAALEALREQQAGLIGEN
jgi:regulator of replication initiation timing